MTATDSESSLQEMCAVTLSRQYGSGGGEIGARLANQLRWALIDHQLVANVAGQLGMTEKQAQAQDERGASFVARVLDSLFVMTPEVPVTPDNLPMTPGQLYHEAVCRVIQEAVRTRHVVIVGRGAQALLQQRRDVLHVRIVAPLQCRIAYVVLREGLSESAARSRIHHKELGRARYLQTWYHRHPDDPLLYDLTINTGVISLDRVTDLIHAALEFKARQLTVPETALGPQAGLAPYRGRPVDIRTGAETERSTQ